MNERLREKPKVLVTGGAGYIGRNVVNFMLSEYEMVVVDNRDDNEGRISDVEYCNIDVRDKDGLTVLMKDGDFDLVIHLAAFVNARESTEKPDLYRDVNYLGTVSLLDAMITCSVSKIIFASSSSVYGDRVDDSIKEIDLLDPISVYGKTKMDSEKAIMARDVDGTILRLFNVAGADLKNRLGEDLSGVFRLIPSVCFSMLQGKGLELYGDGLTERDYVHVLDVAKAISLASKALLDGGARKDRVCVYNVGSGEGISNIQVITAVRDKGGLDIEINRRPANPADPQRVVADVSKIRDELGWNSVFEIEEIVDTTLRWIKMGLS